MTPSPERLDAIRERADAASEGPWISVSKGVGPLEVWGQPPASKTIARSSRENCSFIAHAREDVPWLLAELAAAREREETLAQAIRDAMAFVRTGGPLHTADRLELQAILGAALIALAAGEPREERE